MLFRESKIFHNLLTIPLCILNRHQAFHFIRFLGGEVGFFQGVGFEIVEFDFGGDGVKRSSGFCGPWDDEFRKSIDHHARIQTFTGLFEICDVVAVGLDENGFAFRHRIAI